MKHVEEQLRKWRRIKYLLTRFSSIQVSDAMIVRGNPDEIELFIKKQMDLETFTLKELRDGAAVLRITPIWGLSKYQLIESIQNELSRREEKFE